MCTCDILWPKFSHTLTQLVDISTCALTQAHPTMSWAVKNHCNGVMEWNTGTEYWNNL